MPLDTWATIVSIAVGIMAIVGVGGIVGIWRLINEQRLRSEAERERAEVERRRNEAIESALLGTPAVLDNSGAEIEPAQAGVVSRIGKVEEAVVEFRHSIALYTELAKRVDVGESRAASTEARVGALERDKVERIATKLESAHMWRAVAEAKPETGAEAIPGIADPEPPEEQP